MAVRSLVPQNRAPLPDRDVVTAGPLWPLTLILGDIAARVERRKAEEHADTSSETRRGAGSDPAPRGEAA